MTNDKVWIKSCTVQVVNSYFKEKQVLTWCAFYDRLFFLTKNLKNQLIFIKTRLHFDPACLIIIRFFSCIASAHLLFTLQFLKSSVWTTTPVKSRGRPYRTWRGTQLSTACSAWWGILSLNRYSCCCVEVFLLSSSVPHYLWLTCTSSLLQSRKRMSSGF